MSPGRPFRFAVVGQPKRHVAVMGILNATPDSFSDGGLLTAPYVAARRARIMVEEGAELLDVGAESTRPGASPVAERTELRRLIPILRAVRSAVNVPISVDTTKARVAEAALDEGAEIVNDVSAGRSDPRMLSLVARRGAAIILMHRRGTPLTMQRRPRYRDVVGEIRQFLARRARIAQREGIDAAAIAIDPGIGFGKTLAHNLRLLREIASLTELGYVVAVGASRKGFLGAILGRPVSERTEGSIAAALVAAAGGAGIVRVHDVGPTLRALRVAKAIWEVG